MDIESRDPTGIIHFGPVYFELHLEMKIFAWVRSMPQLNILVHRFRDGVDDYRFPQREMFRVVFLNRLRSNQGATELLCQFPASLCQIGAFPKTWNQKPAHPGAFDW